MKEVKQQIIIKILLPYLVPNHKKNNDVVAQPNYAFYQI